MKNNNVKYGCLQLVTRNMNPELLSPTRVTEPRGCELEKWATQDTPSFGYDPLLLGIPCNNSVRYDPLAQVGGYETYGSFSFSPSPSSSCASHFDDSAWDSEIDDAIEREIELEVISEEHLYDIETGLMNINRDGPSSVSSSTDDKYVSSSTDDTQIPSPQDSKIDMYPHPHHPKNFYSFSHFSKNFSNSTHELGVVG